MFGGETIMKHVKRYMMFAVIAILGLCLPSFSVTAEVFADISITPEKPEQLSTITITANITSDETIEEVFFNVHECKPSLCFDIENISMDFDGENYIAEFTLVESETTYIEYWLDVNFGDSWDNTSTEKTNVTEKSEPNNGNGNGNGGQTEDDNGDGSPGFEIILLMIAVFITYIIFRRKR